MRTRVAALLSMSVVAAGLLTGGPAQAADEPFLGIELRKTIINGGKPIVMTSTSGTATLTVPVVAEIASGPQEPRSLFANLRGGTGYVALEGDTAYNMACVKTAAALYRCTGTAIVHQYDLSGSPGGQLVGLQISGTTFQSSGQYWLQSTPADNVLALRGTKLTAADATPEPARRGGTLTVSGRLTRLDWNYSDVNNDRVYFGLGGQPVKLQFKKNGATSWSTVKTAWSASDGALRTTAPAWSSGTWRWSYAGQGNAAGSDSAGDGVTLLKVAKLTVNAAPEPVRKGKKLTVTGKLTRATTDTATTFTGHAGQPVKLQFRKTGATTWTTVKTVSSKAGGALKTTATAKQGGTWRWSYAGSSTVASVDATGDWVQVE